VLYSVDAYAPPYLVLEVNGDAHSSVCPLNNEGSNDRGSKDCRSNKSSPNNKITPDYSLYKPPI
jgi:hypothetical protein